MIALPRLTPLLLLASLMLSCKPAPAEQFHYTFLLPRGEAPLGTSLFFGDIEVGTVNPAGKAGSDEDRTYAKASTILPRSAGLISSKPGTLRARRTTACGETFAAIKVLDGQPLHARKANDYRWSAAFEQKQRDEVDLKKPEHRHNWPIAVPIDWVAPPTDTDAPIATLYFDDHGASPPPVITIGTLTITRRDPLKTQAFNCARSFPVKVDGTVIGTLELAPRVSYYLISTTPACYQERLITYSSGKDRGPGPSSSPIVHGLGTVIPLLFEPYYFLKPASGTMSGGGTSFTLSEVMATPCPAPR
ncbi:MAG: hypothetical protein ABJE95_28155 [Byssovorax sp.]